MVVGWALSTVRMQKEKSLAGLRLMTLASDSLRTGVSRNVYYTIFEILDRLLEEKRQAPSAHLTIIAYRLAFFERCATKPILSTSLLSALVRHLG